MEKRRKEGRWGDGGRKEEDFSELTNSIYYLFLASLYF
jgi:hypothetical protein